MQRGEYTIFAGKFANAFFAVFSRFFPIFRGKSVSSLFANFAVPSDESREIRMRIAEIRHKGRLRAAPEPSKL